jgi:hypothetical protein
MTNNLPPGVSEDMIPGNSKYDAWYEQNREQNVDLFIESLDRDIIISENQDAFEAWCASRYESKFDGEDTE